MMIMMVKNKKNKTKARKHIKKMKNDENVKKITKNLHIIMQINQIRMKQDFFFSSFFYLFELTSIGRLRFLCAFIILS